MYLDHHSYGFLTDTPLEEGAVEVTIVEVVVVTRAGEWIMMVYMSLLLLL